MNSYTIAIQLSQAEALEKLLKDQGFDFVDRPYTIFFAQKAKLSVAVYEKGPKVVVQGKETEDFVRFYLEPEILKEARVGYEEVTNPTMFEPHFGIDESGKGDFFGPLVIAGVYVDREIARRLLSLGVTDSKKIGSDNRIRQLADEIDKTPGLAANIVLIGPEKYNLLYEKFGNLNDLLAWGHPQEHGPAIGIYPTSGAAVADYLSLEASTATPLAWSPDSRYLAVYAQSNETVGIAAASSLDVIDTQTGTVATIAHGAIYGASFAPDGSDRLVYALAHSLSPSAKTNLYVAEAAGAGVHPITGDGRSLLPVPATPVDTR